MVYLFLVGKQNTVLLLEKISNMCYYTKELGMNTTESAKNENKQIK